MTQKAHRPILIIEDDLYIRELMRELLESEGHEVFTACNGLDGLQKLTQIPAPCLILLDLFMPVMNGSEFLNTLKIEQAHIVATIPIIVISASPPEGDTARSIQSSVSKFMRKPIDLDHFLQVVTEYC